MSLFMGEKKGENTMCKFETKKEQEWILEKICILAASIADETAI